MEASVLRIFRFRPTVPGFDAAFRESVVPELLRAPGFRGELAGRVGPDETGGRILVSLWSSREAMVSALGEDPDAPTLQPRLHGLTIERSVETAEVAVEVGGDAPNGIGIIRVVHGAARPGELERYVDEARDGTVLDRAAGVGPRALYLGVVAADRFVTVSVWDSWDHVEAATGADAAHVDRTRHADRLLDWSADHFEIIPGTAALLPPAVEASA